MATLLPGLFILFTLICLVYYLVFLRYGFKNWAAPSFGQPPVSVIICAKNEAENLRNFLPAFLEQNYPEFELILINDASVDDTLEVIEEFQARDARIKLVNVQNNEAFWANKKYALTLGIKKARYKHLLFTDADCVPQSEFWIEHMVAGFAPEKRLVLGYGGYFKNKKSFLNKLIRYETLLTAIQYFSYAGAGKPYMGVGRNLAYTSDLFYEQKGFANHLHLRSGDDDLFVNEAGNAENTSGIINEKAITRSIPKRSYRDWFEQKRRHVSVAKHYKLSDQMLLGIFYVSRVAFWSLLLILLILQKYLFIAYIGLGALLLVQGLVYYSWSRKLKESDVVWLFPVLEVFLLSSQFAIFIANLFSKPRHWK